MIRGIDSQIMINKSVDYAKQMADQVNNVQQGQDFISEMEKARMTQKDKTVNQTDHAENGRIRREKEGGKNKEKDPKDQDSERQIIVAANDQETADNTKKGISEIGSSIDINI